METLDTLGRRSRMSRCARDKRIQLTARDLAILALLNRYRYLRSTHLHALVGGKSKQRFLERLGALYHEGGYVDRPEQQWQTINARYMPAVYELSEAGEAALKERGILHEGTSSLVRKTRLGATRRYHHELMICDIISSLEIGVRANPDLRFISWPEILAKAPEATRRSEKPLNVALSVSYACPRTGQTQSCDRALVPDAIFGLEYTRNGQKSYRFFALEADRNTEPVVRNTLDQTSYLRKILQYRELAARSLHQTHWGLPNLLVLNVSTNPLHVANIVSAVKEVTSGRGSTFLLFMTMPSLSSLEKAPPATPHILTAAWQRAGHSDLYINQP
jgi:Replication-relaxation